jgi:hypothetical protein
MTAMADDGLEATQANPEIVVVGCDGAGTFQRGWHVAGLLRSQLPAATLIMLSTNVLVVREIGQTLRGQLFDAGIAKPFSISELLACVAEGRATRSQRLMSDVSV